MISSFRRPAGAWNSASPVPQCRPGRRRTWPDFLPQTLSFLTRSFLTMPTRDKEPVVVSGAGVVGVCCALYLLRAGYRVVLLDRNAPGEGASFGNGSIITEEAVVPVQTPGIAREVPDMLVDPLGPLAI